MGKPIQNQNQFIQELEATLLVHPDWYGEVSRKIHSIAQKLTVIKLKEELKVEAPKDPPKDPVVIPQPTLKKPTLLQLYEGKKKTTREVSKNEYRR